MQIKVTVDSYDFQGEEIELPYLLKRNHLLHSPGGSGWGKLIKEETTGYTGNEGSLGDRTYKNAFLIFWPIKVEGEEKNNKKERKRIVIDLVDDEDERVLVKPKKSKKSKKSKKKSK